MPDTASERRHRNTTLGKLENKVPPRFTVPQPKSRFPLGSGETQSNELQGTLGRKGPPYFAAPSPSSAGFSFGFTRSARDNRRFSKLSAEIT